VSLGTGIPVKTDAAGPTPGAGKMPGSSVIVQETQEPPVELVAPDVELVAPDVDSELDNLACGRLPSTRSSTSHDSSFEVIPETDDDNSE